MADAVILYYVSTSLNMTSDFIFYMSHAEVQT